MAVGADNWVAVGGAAAVKITVLAAFQQPRGQFIHRLPSRARLNAVMDLSNRRVATGSSALRIGRALDGDPHDGGAVGHSPDKFLAQFAIRVAGKKIALD